MYNAAGASAGATGSLAATGFSTGHYIVAAIALLACGAAVLRIAWVARRNSRRDRRR